MAITKSTQAGISTMSIVKALHFLCNWPVRVGYMLPRTKDLNDFASTRLDPVINNSDYLKGMKMPYPDSNSTKGMGSSYMFLMEGTVEPRSMPMDALFLDEVDLCAPEHVGTAINRLDASSWKLITYLSTPTLPMFGIDAVFEFERSTGMDGSLPTLRAPASHGLGSTHPDQRLAGRARAGMVRVRELR